jgi:hypothetical protein
MQIFAFSHHMPTVERLLIDYNNVIMLALSPCFIAELCFSLSQTD